MLERRGARVGFVSLLFALLLACLAALGKRPLMEQPFGVFAFLWLLAWGTVQGARHAVRAGRAWRSLRGALHGQRRRGAA
jgi:hypothetical protein